MNTSINKIRKVMTSISIHINILININIDTIIISKENKWYKWHFCVLGGKLSEDVNDVYMLIMYDSIIIITRLHILRMMSFKLLIIMVLILVLKISICITMFIIILTNGWNWMSIVNNKILIKYC